MPTPEPNPDDRRPRFATTRWSLVAAAGQADPSDARHAVGELCGIYWFPLYAEARRVGRSAEDAADLVQGFLTRFVETRDLASADRARGRFRTFLLAAFRNFLANRRDHDLALKRGGGRAPLPIDLVLTPAEGESRLALEPSHRETPERIFDRRWARALLDRALARLRGEAERQGKLELLDAVGPGFDGQPPAPYTEVASRLGMTEGAVKVAAHRLRARCGELIREEVAATVADPGQVADELRHLFEVLAT